jgi:hypothetical protein
MDNIKKLVEDIPYLQIPSEKEEEPQEEEVYQHIETDEEIDNSLKSNFQEMLVDEDGQMSLYMQGGRVAEPQVSGQMSIEDVLTDWEKTKRAAEAALQEAEQRKLESAKARALQEAEELLGRLADVIPMLDSGLTPKDLLDQKYLSKDGQPNDSAVSMVTNMNQFLQQEIDRLSDENAQMDEQLAAVGASPVGDYMANAGVAAEDAAQNVVAAGVQELMAEEEGLTNAAFLRTNIEIIDRFFAPGEVSEIWLTFSDPQMKKATKRLTSTYFMNRYRRFLVPDGLIHLKTDSNFMFTYTKYMIETNHFPVEFMTDDLYHSGMDDDILSIRTYYEQQWLDRGLNIKYIQFHLPQDGELQEPDVEIELDDYRSYNRSKRSGLKTSK